MLLSGRFINLIEEDWVREQIAPGYHRKDLVHCCSVFGQKAADTVIMSQLLQHKEGLLVVCLSRLLSVIVRRDRGSGTFGGLSLICIWRASASRYDISGSSRLRLHKRLITLF